MIISANVMTCKKMMSVIGMFVKKVYFGVIPNFDSSADKKK